MDAGLDLYLDLMMRCLTDWLYDPCDETIRAEGLDWPARAHTMIGRKRLENVRTCVEDVLAQGVPGDLIETGVWRGGATILMRAVLKAHGVTDRVVWVADSFAGLPPPDSGRYPQDQGGRLHTFRQLAVALDEVQDNFRRYGLLDDQVRFLEGWFRETLPTAPIDRLAVLRLDGDMYESTIEALESLYDKVSVGGYIIVDDYGNVAGCRQAVHDFRETREIRDPIRPIDWAGVYWRRSSTAGSNEAGIGAFDRRERDGRSEALPAGKGETAPEMAFRDPGRARLRPSRIAWLAGRLALPESCKVI